MPAIQELCTLYGTNLKTFSREEKIIIELILFNHIINEIIEIQKKYYKNFYNLLKMTKEKENIMLESNFVHCLINDILSTEEYTLNGIAFYTGIPEDVIEELITGINTSPSLLVTRKIIELHRITRPSLYKNLLDKFIHTIQNPPLKTNSPTTISVT